MSIKVKELKDDAKLKIEVNKAYYIMLKNTLMFLLDQESKSQGQEKTLELIEAVKELKYEDMSNFQRSFYTITLAVAEIESIAVNDPSLHEEKEIPEPGEEGYEEPTLD
jgi:ADP-heptose:LPS heptosyltransferase